MNRERDMRISWRAALLSLLVVLGGVELGVRASGLVDFPLYDTDGQIGYIPKPSQAGSFMNENTWVFNDKSMGTAQLWQPQGKLNVLLIGNSIIMGGNPYPQDRKVGPLVQARLGERFAVWPIAAGGWSNVNQSVYMQRHPEVSKAASFFVWEYMQGGLSRPNQWAGEYVFPTHKPPVATWYFLRRYVLPKFFSFNMNELPPTGQTAQQNVEFFERELSRLCASTGRAVPGILFIYPAKQQYQQGRAGQEWLQERQQIEGIAKAHHLNVVDVSTRPEWNESMYREGTHPTVQGNEVLAGILAAEIAATMGVAH
jgi:hypothetical protein